MAAAQLDRTYDEAFDLLVEARNYLTYGLQHPEPGAEPRGEPGAEWTRVDALAQNCEAMRMTTRLAEVMAWLMVQKAVFIGEISQEDALSDDRRLAGKDICLTTDFVGETSLPRGLKGLLERSYRLYRRVERLDALLDHALPPPAHHREPGFRPLLVKSG